MQTNVAQRNGNNIVCKIVKREQIKESPSYAVFLCGFHAVIW